MHRRAFRRVVLEALESLPPEIRGHLDNVVVDVEDEPTEEQLRDLGFTDEEIEAGDSVYGLFLPLDLAQPDTIDFVDQPHRVVIYRRPLEEDFPDPHQLRIEIRKTVIHEVAHHFGWTDRDLERFDATPDPFPDAPN